MNMPQEMAREQKAKKAQEDSSQTLRQQPNAETIRMMQEQIREFLSGTGPWKKPTAAEKAAAQPQLAPIPGWTKKLASDFRKENRGDLSSLPTISGYFRQNQGSTVARVWMDEAAFLTPQSKSGALYTSGAFECGTIVATVRDPFSGKVKKVGLTHISPYLLEEDSRAVESFFRALLADTKGNVEVTLISGGYPVPQEAFRTAKKYGKVVFMNCEAVGLVQEGPGMNEDSFRSDCVLVDRQGKVYHAQVHDFLAKFDGNKSEYLGKEDRKFLSGRFSINDEARAFLAGKSVRLYQNGREACTVLYPINPLPQETGVAMEWAINYKKLEIKPVP